jgi:PTH2 family peptidyl-tRNA hydrolase
MPKQVIVMRKDLGMRKGKMIAQGSHAVLGAILSGGQLVNLQAFDGTRFLTSQLNPEAVKWLGETFTKICVSVNSEEELLGLKAQADKAGIRNSLITDAGHTEFHGIPTITCMAIGPDDEEKIDKITGDLPLL